MTIVLYPSHLQAARLEHFLFVGRVAYNRALESRVHWYKTSGKGLSYYDQCADLTALRNADSFWGDAPVQVERDALHRLDKSFKAFFRRVRAAENPAGFPRFKGHNRWRSFTVPVASHQRPIKGSKVFVCGVGLMRARNVRPVEGAIKQQRIIRQAGKWFCQLVIDDGLVAPTAVPIRSAIGIDVGLKTWATLSNNDTIPNPRFGKKLARKLAHAHRNVSRAVKGSRNRRKAVARLQRVYAKIQNQRSNFTHHASKKIVAEHQLIAVEDLNVASMIRGRLAKSILDACWAQFTWQLSYKAEKAGATFLRVDPRGTTQDCSQCGQTVPKDLSIRIHRCSCGLVVDRDLNAARNVLKRALRLSAPASGGGDTVMPVEDRVAGPVKQEVLRRSLAVSAN